MGWFDDLIPDASDPKTGAILGMLAGLGKAATPQYDPAGRGIKPSFTNALFGTLGDVAGGVQGGMKGAQEYQQGQLKNQLDATRNEYAPQFAQAGLQAQNTANQGAGLNLDLQKAAQPGNLNFINATNNMVSPGSLAGGMPAGAGPADALFSMAYMQARRSGDSKQASQVLTTWAEHNPALAKELETAKAQGSVHETPNGPQFGISGLQGAPNTPAFGSMAGPSVASAVLGLMKPTDPAPIGPDAQMKPIPLPPSANNLPSGGSPMPQVSPVDAQELGPVASARTPPVDMALERKEIASEPLGHMPNAQDGKPYIPGTTNLFKPNISGAPKYDISGYPNTTVGVASGKKFVEEATAEDIKANGSFTGEASSLQNEQFRLKELGDIYKQVQSGTLTAQNPELVNKLIAWGVVKDPQEIKNVAGIQKALMNHALQIVQQIKDTNANLGGAPVRTFGSEITNLQEKGENPAEQPEALHEIISEATGIVNHHLDMVKGWESIGGLGNRAANGNTLRPNDYARKFIGSHDITDYKEMAGKQMGPFKGMAGNNAAPQINYKRVNGKLVKQ